VEQKEAAFIEKTPGDRREKEQLQF